jgi:hypothetical protein
MPQLSDNPFAVLTAIVAPAILTNACSVLSLGTANRIARVVDQTRALLASRGSAPESRRPGFDRQLKVLERRGTLLLRALRIFYGSLGAFAASALLAIVGSALAAYDFEAGFRTAAAAGFITGSAGVSGLVAGCALMVREVRLAIRMLTNEIEVERPPVNNEELP